MNKFNFIVTKDYINTSCSIDERALAVAEISKLPDKTWYFNRIFVPDKYRNHGIATKLMEKLIDIVNEHKIVICCDINPYGDLSYSQLKQFYKKYGFIEDDVFDLRRDI